VIAAMCGVCATDAAEGAEVEVKTTGVFDLPKATGVINGFAMVWWSTADGNVKNASATGLYPIDYAVDPAASGDATVRVRLAGTPVTAV
jgi:predicted RecA/RadA family phage recombinase